VTTSETDFTKPHTFTVTFPVGYDDGGQVPVTAAYPSSVYTRGGTKASSATVSVVDQRFSNSLWMGEISGWHEFVVSGTGTVFTGAGSKPTAENGDTYEFSSVEYGMASAGPTVANNITTKCVVAGKVSILAIPCITSIASADGKAYGRIDYTADRPTQTSQQTEDYFAVGAAIEVMTTTWADGALGTDVVLGVLPTADKNKHRKFTVLSHVKNGHGKMFAKLDSSPETDSSTDYTLRVTSNNGTTTAFKTVNIVAGVNEVQNIRVTDGKIFAPVLAETFRLYINKGKWNEEFTEVVTHGSTNAQIAEAINSFAALSGPVKVTNQFHGFNTGQASVTSTMVVTFDAIDGDVPLLHAEPVGTVSGSATLSTSTIRHGSSISGGAGARFENIEAGGTINVTSAETVTFGLTTKTATADTVVTFSYDGIMSGLGITLDDTSGLADADHPSTGVDSALASIVDDNGDAVIGAASEITGAYSHTDNEVTITLPKGMSGSKLEMHVVNTGDHASTTKTVFRNNNGKTFRIKRVDHEKVTIPLADNTITAAALTITREDYNFRVGDEVAIASCSGTAADAPCGGNVPCPAKATALATTAAGSTVVVVALKKLDTTTDASDFVGCTATLIRDTLILDSIPDAMNGAVDIAYTAPSGSCSVAEVTKGSSESATCSNRGSCDGGSGLCVCHEGYSGESCETQTVLV
jgi:hypothetical protein